MMRVAGRPDSDPPPVDALAAALALAADAGADAALDAAALADAAAWVGAVDAAGELLQAARTSATDIVNVASRCSGRLASRLPGSNASCTVISSTTGRPPASADRRASARQKARIRRGF